jgi:hypothetical protein
MPPASSADPELRSEAKKIEGFQRWLEKSEVKLLLAILPPGESEQQKECLLGLLRSAFLTGYGTGEGAVAVLMLEAIMKRKEEDKR